MQLSGSTIEEMQEELRVKRKHASSEDPVKKQRSDGLDLWGITGVSKTHDLTVIASLLPKKLQWCAEEVAHFFLYMYERQMAWDRRNKEESPYTKSVIIQNYFFTNVRIFLCVCRMHSMHTHTHVKFDSIL
jgi:hypothetical protein